MFHPSHTLTQDSKDHAILQNFEGTGTDKIIGLKGISLADQVFPWCTERSLDVQGEGTETPSTGSLKHRQLQDVFVQMHGDVCAQFIWEVMQQLREDEDKTRL